MWTVLESTEVLKAIRKLQPQIVANYEFWKNVVVQSGPTGLRSFKGMHDEALAGKLKGLRSSRLSKGYRVIYRVEKTAVCVQVLDINAHDYRR
jgi:addiction module RelE/StbE family toxin